MQLRNYYGYYKDVLILTTYAVTALVIGILIISDQVEPIIRLALFMGISLGTSMVSISLKEYSSRLKPTQARGALWQAFGIPAIWTIWFYLLVIMVFKYI